MWTFILRRLLYNVPVYLGILALMMGALRVNDPISGKLGKNPDPSDYLALEQRYGLDQPFAVQYVKLLGDVVTLDFTDVESWTNDGLFVGEMLAESIVPSLAITVPALCLTSVLAISIAIISAFFRGRPVDKTLMVLAVVGMSVSFLVYVIFGQYWFAYLLGRGSGLSYFAIGGYESGLANWPYYCLLPVLISTFVAMGYDTRFYRAVMVEESGRDYITTAKAKGATKTKIMFVHMLKNAMIPIITRIMTTLPFLVMGSLLLEVYFNIPGMGRVLYKAIQEQDFPVVQTFVAIFAALFILSNILTDVLYALVDPPRATLLMAKFMQQRGVKKLLKDRLAVVSMWVIGAYLLVALGVLVGNLFTEGGLKSETELRIGPDNVPGAWATQSAEARLRDATFYLDSIKKASRGSDPAAAYAALEWGSDRLPAWKPDRIESEIIEPADEISTALADHRELEGNVEALALLDRLEQVVRARIGASHDESGNAQRSAGQSFRMLLGTDRQGRSILVRAIYSTKVAVQIGVVSALISVLIGTILGAAAGYFGGVVDVIVVWLYSTFSSIPWIVLLMVLASAFRGGDWDGTLIPVYAAFCLSFWISPCRVVRGEVMKLKELEYVQAASAIGFGRARILFKHVIPNTAHLMFINFSLLFIGAIKAEVILSFLGLGVKNEPSWGVMINHAKAEVLNGFFWQIGTATVFMVILVLAFNTLSDALQDAFDPKHV